jgi:hypothetical protein
VTNLTVNPKFKVAVVGDTIIISNDYALIILCAHCGNVRNVFLHHEPTGEEMKSNNALNIGGTQYPAFKYCHCDAPNSGGGYSLQEVYQAVEKCKSVDEALRMIRYFRLHEGAQSHEARNTRTSQG